MLCMIMEESVKFANIIVDISHEKLDKTFQYIIPKGIEDEIHAGCRVEIPFGKANRMLTGYVIEVTDLPEFDVSKMKSVKGVKKGSLMVESQLIALAYFIKQRYGSTMNKALKTVIPIKQSVKHIEKKYLQLNIGREEAHELVAKYSGRKNTASRAKLIQELIHEDSLEYQLVVSKLQVSESVIKNLVAAGIIRVDRDTVYRNPVTQYSMNSYEIELNEQQRQAADEIIEDIQTDNPHTHLLYGVTGSGKTEVYMEIIHRVIEGGREAIVLIPEIALTYQTIRRFYNRFGSQVSIIHSRLSAGEKCDQFERAFKGEVKIMIGPRSALFTPFRHLGVIIIDEEHEAAYKSEQVPKYHAREVAIERARIAGAGVVLGSATPAISTYYKALAGEYCLHKLGTRVNNRDMAQVHLVDLREELEQGNRDIFSSKLLELIQDRLERNEQMMLFINRRGYASFVSCRACGKPIRCPHCDVSLTLHRKKGTDDRLVCHYCGYTIPLPVRCPHCSSKYIGRFGLGTEQVEERIHALFPNAKTLRMDMDTTRGKGGYEHILSAFAGGEADILVGTQMIVKGHDFSNVTLVGIIAADLSLFSSDYMAAERTFQLLTQAAGRAGRGEAKGEVVIQTYSPEEMCIQTAVKQDYEEFYRNEIGYRTLMAYPPVYHMCAILISHRNEEKADRAAADIAERIRHSQVKDLTMMGPAKAAIAKINDIYRNVIYIKHIDSDIIIKIENGIQRYLNMVEDYHDVSVQFDFNPMSNY